MADEEERSETDLSTDLTYGGQADTQFGNQHDFSDLPGDVKFAADGGASLTLGQEGLVVLKASPTAQLVLGSLMNFCKIVSREMEMCSDFGSIKMTNGSSGRCGLIMEGGADYGEESEPSGGTPTCRFFMGDVEDSPDMRMGFFVNATDGSGASGMFIGKDGKMRFASTDDVLYTIGSDCETLIQGDDAKEVDGDQVHQIQGERDTTVMIDDTETIGGTKNQGVAGDYTLSVGGTLQINAAAVNISSAGDVGGACEMRCSSFNLVKG